MYCFFLNSMVFNATAMLLLKQVTYKVLTVTEIHVPPM